MPDRQRLTGIVQLSQYDVRRRHHAACDDPEEIAMSLHLTRNTFLGLVAAGSISVGGLATLTAANASSAGTQAQPPRIEVTMRPWLAQQSGQRNGHLRVAYRLGISAAEVAEQAGLRADEVGSIMAVRNGVQVDLETPLAAGDHLELITGMAGG